MNNKEFQKKWSEIIAKAWSDPSFKEELISNPSKVLKKHGMDVKGMNVEIVENTNNKCYFVLPQKPNKQMSEKELKEASAAAWSISSVCS